MNLLILSPDYSKRVNWGHQHIRDALLSRVENSIQYGEKCKHHGKLHIPSICEEVSEVIGYPDVILLENPKNMARYTGATLVDCVKVFMVCDYFPDTRGNIFRYNKMLNDFGVDLAICASPDSLKHLRNQKDQGHLSPSLYDIWVALGVNIDIFRPRELPKIYDVMAVFGLDSHVYPERELVQEKVKRMRGVTSLIGSWTTNVKRMDYARAISQSKIFVCSNGVNDQVLMKYFEAMASGTFLLTNLPRNCEKYGLIPGEHFAVWEGVEDLKDRIYYYLSHDEHRENIAKAGRNIVREFYSTQVTAKQIHKAIATVARQPMGELDEEERVAYETGIIGG